MENIFFKVNWSEKGNFHNKSNILGNVFKIQALKSATDDGKKKKQKLSIQFLEGGKKKSGKQWKSALSYYEMFRNQIFSSAIFKNDFNL